VNASALSRPGLLVLLTLAVLGAACRNTPATPAPEAAAPAVSADTWATVDTRAISREDVDKAFRRARDVSRTLSSEEELTAKLAILDELILEDLLLARAAALKIEVPATELDAAYNQARSNIPEPAFQEELTRRNVTAADMREGLRRQLLSQKVLEREVTSKVAISDKEITDFFNANRAQFNLAEDAYRIAQIVITASREPRLANRTGDDATTAQAAAEKSAMLMEKLKGGAVFTDLARDYSEDPESAPRGGDLGFMPLSAVRQAPPALRDAVLTAAPGTVRVVTQGGDRTLVLLVAKEPAGQRELTTAGVREGITNTLRGRKEQLMRTAYLTALRNDARVVNYLAKRVVETQGAL
jgi:peptidyl-prolyl cis-trans isomerase SurA